MNSTSNKIQISLADMDASLDALFEGALGLPTNQRLNLAKRLLESVENLELPLEEEKKVESAWEAEIAQRIARFKSGESKPIPAEEVFAQLKQIAPDQ